ncbi:MAG: Coq4 family protein [Nannocystaceae bacterium]
MKKPTIKPVRQLLRGIRLVRSLASLIRDPNQLDVVFALADDSVDPEEEAELLAVLEPVVRERLADPSVTPPAKVDLPALRLLPVGTFGRAVADFFDANGFDPAGLYHSDGPAVADFERFKLHMERTHDLWHVVTGMGTDVDGELGLQAFTLAQTGAPLANLLFAAGFLNAIFYSPGAGPQRLEAITAGWRIGKAARPLFGAPWEAMWTWPLEQVREHFGIAPWGAEAVRPAA